jgi:hypothetical protein
MMLLLCAGVAVSESPSVDFSSSAERFQQALKEGVDHVVIMDHLDLRGLQPMQSSSGGDFVGLLNGTKSIRVCSCNQVC